MFFWQFIAGQPQPNDPELPHSPDEHQAYPINTPKLLHHAITITTSMQLFITISPLLFLIYH